MNDGHDLRRRLIREIKRKTDVFWNNVPEKDPSRCWHWRGIERQKYGFFWLRWKHVAAHRIAHYLSTGNFNRHPVLIRHLCNKKSCVNPNHLAAGTASENQKDHQSTLRREVVEMSPSMMRWLNRVAGSHYSQQHSFLRRVLKQAVNDPIIIAKAINGITK